jgi:hypothetical protein
MEDQILSIRAKLLVVVYQREQCPERWGWFEERPEGRPGSKKIV